MYPKAKRLIQLALRPVLLLLALLSSSAFAEEALRWETNMSPGVTANGQAIYDLHMYVFWVCVWIGVVVFGVMFYSMYAHRKSSGRKPATFHESTKLEILWTIIPFVILATMAAPATKALLNIYNTDDADMSVLITGYQWKWKYEYIGQDDKISADNVSFFSNLRTAKDEIGGLEEKNENYLLEVDEPLVIPVNKKVRFLMTANDVIHSWWVPALAVKKDAIPGFVNEAWTKATKIGVYRGQCAELCGRDHGFMPIVVNVVSQADYDKWLAGKAAEAAKLKELMSKQFTLDEQMVAGKAIYDKNCMACHGANGEGGVGKKIAGSAIAMGAVDGHLQVVVKGVPGSAMQAFGSQLNDVDLAAVVTYQRNAFGNNMGDQVQPVDVYKFKQGK